MTRIQAHLVCIALVAVDVIVRTWRFQWILRGLRFDVPFRDVLALNLVGDAASAITPLRIGGEPARLAALARERIPLTAGLVAVGIEIVVMWPVILIASGILALLYAPQWWTEVEPHLASTVRVGWPWVALVVAASVLTWIAARRAFPSASHTVRRSMRRALAYARRMPRWPLLAGIPLTLVGLAARVAILPVLALTLSSPPPIGPLSFASFALLYGQLLLPTPSGAGVVELGFLGGAVGDLGGELGAILLLWRFYTTFVLVALGLVLGVRHYGRAAVSAMLRGRPAAAAARAVPERD
ncbi:MAG TPA: lysylphosphatidylglycerol synthase transmembrane domain-containing protein [Gemmatimonadaceae bacterium]|nr:lysylphosphatidylglycerol synthase transmembrane domain-containing protein [Gemmatimonadaceae bacterium]